MRESLRVLRHGSAPGTRLESRRNFDRPSRGAAQKLRTRARGVECLDEQLDAGSVTIVRREVDIAGKEEMKASPEIENLFQIYPSQLVLGGKEKRTVRVTWIGDPKLKLEQAFRIIAEELPINLDEPGKVYQKAVGRVTLTSRYIGSLYVGPPGAAPRSWPRLP